MNILVLVEAKASSLKITDEAMLATLVDGREVKVPLLWFPKLFQATPSQRNNFRFIGEGIGIHWPELDEDLSIAGILAVR